MIKIITSIITFILGRYDQTLKKSILLLVEQLIQQSRKLFIVVTIVSINSLLFISGILISTIQATNQFDANGYIILTSGIALGLILTFVPLLALIYIFSSSTWDSKFKKQFTNSETAQQTGAATAGALEQTLTLLLVNFLKEHEHSKINLASKTTSLKNENSKNFSTTVNSSNFSDTIN
ncbi:MAG: hypothetical protein WA160_09235 [Pseudobdellovibrio sp.]